VRPLAALVLIAALAASACSSGSDSAEEQPGPPQDTTPAAAEKADFTKAQLPELALQPSDAPPGMRYTKPDSGRKTLFDVGIILEDQVAQIRGMGIQGIYDATFDSTSTDVRLASRIWLFKEPEGAVRWFEKSRSETELYGFEQITAPRLGADSWAARGNVGAAVISYAFRTSNVVVVTTYSTQSQELSESEAIAAAQKAEARLRRA
jgi:hypothetical protein